MKTLVIVCLLLLLGVPAFGQSLVTGTATITRTDGMPPTTGAFELTPPLFPFPTPFGNPARLIITLGPWNSPVTTYYQLQIEKMPYDLPLSNFATYGKTISFTLFKSAVMLNANGDVTGWSAPDQTVRIAMGEMSGDSVIIILFETQMYKPEPKPPNNPFVW